MRLVNSETVDDELALLTYEFVIPSRAT
jgi:hypothetical protein